MSPGGEEVDKGGHGGTGARRGGGVDRSRTCESLRKFFVVSGRLPVFVFVKDGVEDGLVGRKGDVLLVRVAGGDKDVAEEGAAETAAVLEEYLGPGLVCKFAEQFDGDIGVRDGSVGSNGQPTGRKLQLLLLLIRGTCSRRGMISRCSDCTCFCSDSIVESLAASCWRKKKFSRCIGSSG